MKENNEMNNGMPEQAVNQTDAAPQNGGEQGQSVPPQGGGDPGQPVPPQGGEDPGQSVPPQNGGDPGQPVPPQGGGNPAQDGGNGQSAFSEIAGNLSQAGATVVKEKLGRMSSKKKKIAIAAGCVVVILLVIALLAGRRTAIDMKDYVSVAFSGIDGKGTASVSVDYDGISSKIAENTKKSSKQDWQEALGGLADNLLQWSQMQGAIDYEIDKSNGLSNGDKVKVTILTDEDLCKALNIKVKHTNLSFDVQGLVEVESFDAFADISVSFSGISPNGEAELINNSHDEACMSYDYSLDQYSGLANGDTVTVTISDGNIDAVAEQTGKAPAEMQKQYTVSGLSSYVTKLDQVTDAALQSMQKEAEDYISASTARRFASTSQLTGKEYLGSYLKCAKPGAGASHNNWYYLVYKLTVLSTYKDANQSFDYYFFVAFPDLVLNGSNEIEVDLSDYETTNNTYEFEVEGSGFWVYGYETLAELFDDCITKSLDNYTYESSIQE